MAKNKILIGIDGGGSKTKAVVSDQDLNIIGTGISGPSNIRLSVKNSWESIYEAINKALKDTDITLSDKKYNFHIGLGLAGISVLSAKEKFLKKKHPFKTLILESDAHVACLGANNGKDGGIISIGTGIIGYAIINNKSFRVGGWGFPHADTGSGAWMGMEAVRSTFKSIDNIIKPSELHKKILAKFKNNLSDLIQWANNANSTNFASLMPIIIESAQKAKDKHSISLLNTSGNEVYNIYLSLQHKVKKYIPNLVCYLTGGISDYICDYLPLHSRNLIKNNPKNTPGMGAIYMIKKTLLASYNPTVF